MSDTHNPHVLRTDPANGILMESGGKRFLTGGRVEVWVTVDGKEQWREARWESEVVSELCSRRGIERTEAPVLRPVLREGERLIRAADGRSWIESRAYGMPRAGFPPPYGNGSCPKCGAPLIGDGYTTVLHCENADPESYAYHEPDAQPVYCEFVEEKSP